MVTDDSHWDIDSAYVRDVEREPSGRFARPARQQLTTHGTLRRAHEDAEAKRITTTTAVIAGTTCVIEYFDPRPGYTRKGSRARCLACGFCGTEYGPALAGYAIDDAKAHTCGGDS